MVGVSGFEPETFCTPSKRATSLRHTPRKSRRIRLQLVIWGTAIGRHAISKSGPDSIFFHHNLGPQFGHIGGDRFAAPRMA